MNGKGSKRRQLYFFTSFKTAADFLKKGLDQIGRFISGQADITVNRFGEVCSCKSLGHGEKLERITNRVNPIPVIAQKICILVTDG